MKKLYKSKNAGKIAAYSAMAGAFVALSSDANAAVVYNDIEDETIDLGGDYALDMDEDGVVDFLFLNLSLSSGNWTVAVAIGNSTVNGYGGDSNMVIGYSGPALSYGSAFDAGEVVGPDGSFIANAANSAVIASLYGGNTYGAFANEMDKFMGVQFEIDGDIHYGWIRLDASVDPTSVTIKDYAYEDVADATIETGQTTGGGINIVTLTESQVSAYSFGNAVNVNVKDLTAGISSVTIFDIDGKIVYTNGISSNSTSITLDNVATGLYTIQLTGAENAVYTKNLYIQN